MLYAAIHRQPHTLGRNVRAVVRGRLHAIARAPFSIDGVSAAVSAVVEVGTMFACWGRWRQEVKAILAREQ